MQYPNIQAILTNTKFSLGIFSATEIQSLEDRITTQVDKKDNLGYYVECLKRGSIIKMTPEEVVRQIFLFRLFTHYKFKRMKVGAKIG